MPVYLSTRVWRSLDEYGESASVAGYPVCATEGQDEPLDVRVSIPLDFTPRSPDPRERDGLQGLLPEHDHHRHRRR